MTTEHIDIARIVELLIAIAGSAIVTRILTIRARVRQGNADADKAEAGAKSDQIENIEKMVEKAYKPLIDDLTKQVQKLQEKVEKLEEIKDKQNERIDELEEENRKLRAAVREVNPESVPSMRGENGKHAPRNASGQFIKKEEQS